MTSLLLKSNTLTATMAALCWLCSHSLGLLLLWALLLVPYALMMLWWVMCCERFEERAVPSDRGLPEPSRYPPMPPVRRPYKFIGADDTKPRAHKPPSNA